MSGGIRKSCRCEVVNYLTSRVPDNPKLGRIEHLYQCPSCEWVISSPEYEGRRINREEESRE